MVVEFKDQESSVFDAVMEVLKHHSSFEILQQGDEVVVSLPGLEIFPERRKIYRDQCDGLIDAFHKSNNEIVVSTYRMGITITGVEVAGDDLDDLCSVENGKYLIQRSRLGIMLAFLKQEQVKIEWVCGDKGDGIGFVFPKGAKAHHN